MHKPTFFSIFLSYHDFLYLKSVDFQLICTHLDRDSELVAPIYDESNPAVKSLISQVIKAAKKNKRKIGLCGDAPSSSKEFAKFLVERSIDSMSLTPDAIIKTTLSVLDAEKKLKKRQ